MKLGDHDLVRSNIMNNGYGVFNDRSSVYPQMENNWWGATSGPFHPLSNSDGQGDSVNVSTFIDPWLTTPDTVAPPLPAQDLEIADQGEETITVRWRESPLPDFASFNVYWDNDSTLHEFDRITRAVQDTSITITRLESDTASS